MSSFIDDEANQDPMTEPSSNEENNSSRFVPVGLVEAKGSFFYGVYVPPNKTLEFEQLLVRKGFLRIRDEDCDDIKVNPPKKRKIGQSSSSRESQGTQNNSRISKNDQVKRLAELIGTSTLVPKEMTIGIPAIDVRKDLTLEQFKEEIKQFRRDTKTVHSLIQRVEELEKGFLFLYYKVHGVTGLENYLTGKQKLNKKKTSNLGEFAQAVQVNQKVVKAGLTTLLLNDLVKKDDDKNLVIFNTVPQGELEQGWSYMNQLLKNCVGQDWKKKYDDAVKDFKAYPDIQASIDIVLERETEL